MASFLTTNEVLNMNDTLVSDNGCFTAILQSDGNFVTHLSGTFPYPYWTSNVVPGPASGPYFAIMQTDGNFVVYRGTGPNNIEGVVWATNVFPGPAAGPYFAVMQNDGNFVVYRGTDPDHIVGVVWATNRWIQASNVAVSNVIFDLDHAVMGPPQIVNANRQDLTNDSTVDQQETFTFEIDYQETQKWTTTNAVKVGLQTTIHVGIPFIVEGKIQISAEYDYTFTYDEEQQTTKKYTDSIPVKVPAHSQITCTASVSTTNITIPYTADAVYTLLVNFTGFPGMFSPIPVPGNLKGVYTGDLTYDLQATWTQAQPV